MISALRVFFRSFGDLWFNLVGYAVCNLAAALSLLVVATAALMAAEYVALRPLLIPLALALALAVPAMLLGLLQVAHDSLPYNERPELGQLLRRTRQVAARGWKLGLAYLVGTLVLFTSFWFYSRLQAAWALPLRLITGGVCWTWLGVMLYAGPLLLRSERGVRTALRNALVAMLHYPLFTSTLLLLTLPVLALSVVAFPIFALAGLAFLAILGTRATDWVLMKEGLMPEPAPPPEEAEAWGR